MVTPTQRSGKTDITTLVLHWSLVAVMLFSMATGLRITVTDSEPTLIMRLLDRLLPQGNVIKWHISATYPFLLVLVAYFVFLGRARLQSRIALDRSRMRSLTATDHTTRWAAINVLLYWIAFVLLATITSTGMLLYYATDTMSSAPVTMIHRMATWALLIYVVLHVLAQLNKGGINQLLKILNPRAAYGTATLITLLFTGVVGAAIFVLDGTNIKNLQVASVNHAPIIDGDAGDEVWANTGQLTIETHRGANNPGGDVPVTIRMVHDNERVYTLVQWPDSTRSLKHLPLVKGEDGWRMIQTGFAEGDENQFYEDALSIMIAPYEKLGTIYLGTNPVAGKPGPASGRGLHYTSDGSRVDIWHWRAVRSGNALMNQIDDSSFGPPAEPQEGKRYTGGYVSDPETGDGGGFHDNWQPLADNDGFVQPLRLPKDPRRAQQITELDLSAEVSDDDDFWMATADTVEYSEKLDDEYTIGSVIPSVLIDRPFQGDRGDVQGVARWKDGWWTLEATRKLDTGSEYDVPLSTEKPAYLRIAVFDHTQHRHSWHPHPIRVILK
jgi:hypothetical protein